VHIGGAAAKSPEESQDWNHIFSSRLSLDNDQLIEKQ
jgi:hypothetical protein